MSRKEAVDACNALGLFGGLRLVLIAGRRRAGETRPRARRRAASPEYFRGGRARRGARAGDAGEVPAGRPARGMVEAQRACWPTTCRSGRASANGCAPRLARRPRPRRRRAHAAARARGRRHAGAGERGREARAGSRGEPITDELVDAISVLVADPPPWGLTDALGDRRTGRGDAGARAAARRPRRRCAPLGALARAAPAPAGVAQHVSEQGGGPNEVARALGLRRPSSPASSRSRRRAGLPSSSRPPSCASRRSRARRAGKACCATGSRSSARSRGRSAPPPLVERSRVL